MRSLCCLKSICNPLLVIFAVSFSSLSFSKEGHVFIGANSGVYSGEDEGEDKSDVYTTLDLGYEYNDFGLKGGVIKSSENNRNPYFNLSGFYNFHVGDKYILQPTVGLNFVDEKVNTNLGLGFHYLISDQVHLILDNQYRTGHSSTEYFFGVGFEYHFVDSKSTYQDVDITSKPNVVANQKTDVDDFSQPRNKCHKELNDINYYIRDDDSGFVWDTVIIGVKGKFLAKTMILDSKVTPCFDIPSDNVYFIVKGHDSDGNVKSVSYLMRDKKILADTNYVLWVSGGLLKVIPI